MSLSIMNEQIFPFSSNEKYMEKSNILLLYLNDELSFAASTSSSFSNDLNHENKKLSLMYYMFPSVVAEIRHSEKFYETCLKLFGDLRNYDAIDVLKNENILIGDMAEQYALFYPNTTLRSLLQISEIFMDEHVQSFNIIESIYSSLFRRFNIEPNKTKIISVMPTMTDDFEISTLEEMVQKSFSLLPIISLRSCEFMIMNSMKPNGLAIEWTSSGIVICPVINSKMIKEDIYKVKLGKRHFTEMLRALLHDDTRFAQLCTIDQELIIKQILARYCYISDDKLTRNKNERGDFVLTGGKFFEMKLTKDMRCCLDTIFEQISEQDNERKQTLAEAIVAAILLCPDKYHEDLFKNIVLSHDLYSVSGLLKRLRHDIATLVTPKKNFEITSFEWKEEKIELNVQEILGVIDSSRDFYF